MRADLFVPSIPESLRKEVEAHLHLRQQIDPGDVTAIIEALDQDTTDDKEALCSRLDLRSSVILCGILKRSEDCLAYQRGVYLLTVRLRPGELGFS